MVEVRRSQSPRGCWALKDSPIFESPEPVTILGPLARGIRAAGWLALGKGHSPVSSRWASCNPHDCCRWKGEVEKAIPADREVGGGTTSRRGQGLLEAGGDRKGFSLGAPRRNAAPPTP